MTVSCVASASSRVWSRAVMAGLFGSAICLLAPEGRAQTTVIGDVTVTGNATVQGDATVEGGLTVHDAANLGGINITNSCLACGINMGGSNIFGANNVTASGTIQGGTLKSTGETQVGTKLTVGGDASIGGNLDMTNGDITKVKSITGDGTGNISGFANISGGTLSTSGNASVGGDLDMTGGDIKNVATITAATVNAGTLSTSSNTVLGDGVGGDTLTVNANSTFNGTLKANNGANITGGINNNGGGITNAGAISGATDITASGKVEGATLKSTGETQVGTNLKVGGNATVGGNLTVSGESNLNGANIGNHLTVLPSTKVNMGGNVVQGVADPVLGSDAANKQYVDAGLSRAFRDIDRNTQGIAIAMAMGGMALPDSKNFALGANLGFFDSKQAMAIQGAMRLTPFVSVNGGIGMGLDDSSTLGGRVGVQVAW